MTYDTVSNAINATRANSVIDYNDASHPICIGFRVFLLQTILLLIHQMEAVSKTFQ